ncbi:sensor histidine kinase [Sunxiuqinia elliptica]
MERYFALKIAVAYFILGFLWILFSDYLLQFFIVDLNVLTKWQNYKGWFYIAVTALMLYWLIRRQMQRKNRLLDELEAARLKAEESDRLKTAFLSNMSHEIRTPLNGILGFSNLISEENVPVEQKQLYLKQINSNGKLLLKIINDIIEVSKIQENQLAINYEQVDLPLLLDNFLKAYTLNGNAFKKKGLELRVLNRLDSESLIIETDPSRLLQVLVNLMDNAIKYTAEGWIAIGYRLENAEVQIWVEDTGSGIAPENQQIIFERFKQTSTSKKTGAGFGLGLSISKGIIEALQGSIQLNSKLGNGSRFLIKLPLKTDLQT